MPRFTDRFLSPTPKYRKHRASGRAVVTLYGQDRYLGPYGTKASRIEYDRLIGERLTTFAWGAEAQPVKVLWCTGGGSHDYRVTDL